MKNCLLLVFGLLAFQGFAQLADLKLDKSNNNTIKIIQAGSYITYNLANQPDVQQFLSYLRSLPSIQKQLRQLDQKVDKTQQGVSRIEQRGASQDKLLLEIARNTSKEGFVSQDEYNKGLESYILKNKQLEDELAKFKSQYQNTEFATVLAQAEEKLKQLDNESYQQLLEAFKQQRKAKLKQDGEEIAQATYLQAKNYENQFRYQEAFQQVEEALEYSAKNPNYLLLKGDMLIVLQRSKEAIDIYLSLSKLELSDSLQGLIYNNIGLAYLFEGLYDQTIEYCNKALPINLKEFGPEHQYIADSYNYIGSSYSHKGSYDLAIEYHNKALPINLKAFGPEHQNVGSLYNNLGDDYLQKAVYDMAIDYYSKALQIYVKVFGPEHQNVAYMYNRLGLAYDKNKLYDQAIEYYNKTLFINLNAYGPEHQVIVYSYNCIAEAYNHKGSCDLSIEYYDKALKIRYNDPHSLLYPTLGILYNNIGLVYCNMGLYDQAIENYNKALPINLKMFGQTSSTTQKSLQGYGLTLIMAQQTSKGLTYLEQSKEYNELSLNKKIAYFNSKGADFFNAEKYQLAIKFYLAAEYVCKQSKLDKSNELWAIVAQNIGKVHCYMGHKTEAAKYFEQAFVYCQALTDTTVKERINYNYEECKKR